MTTAGEQLTELLLMLREGKAEFYRGPHPDAMMSYIGTAEGMAERLLSDCAEQAREIERLRAALNTVIEGAECDSELPCRVDEMTEREVAIFNIAADASGALSFIWRTARAALSGASDVNHGPGGVNSQSTAAELRDARVAAGEATGQ